MHDIKKILGKIGDGDSVMKNKLAELMECLIADSKDPRKYEHKLYVLENGYHFNKEKLDKAMISKEMKWSVDTACSIMTSHGISFSGEYECVTPYDKCYVMNMMYCKYYPLISDSASAAKFSEKYIKDPEYPIKGGKAYAEWMLKCELEDK